MRVALLAFPTDDFPCFGFAVCSENGKRYLPEYGEDDTVCGFEETVFDAMCLKEYTGEYAINKGDGRTYVYLLDKGKFIVGKMKDIRSQLTQALPEIKDAPFSRLELAEFLSVDRDALKAIHEECCAFLEKIDEKQARQWKLDNADIFVTESKRVRFEDKYTFLPEHIFVKIKEAAERIQKNNFDLRAETRLAV